MEALSFCVASEWYAADVRRVERFARHLEVTFVPTAPMCVLGIANIKGKACVIVDLGVLLREKGALTCGGRIGSGSCEFSGDENFEFSGFAGNSGRVDYAVIFKPFGDGDQMGLAVDRPGGLIEVGDCSQSRWAHVSGVVEQDGLLYRLLDIESIVARFGDGHEPQGGTDEATL